MAVAGAKAARFTHDAIEQALSTLRDCIQAINDDKNAEYRVSEALRLEISYPRYEHDALLRIAPLQTVSYRKLAPFAITVSCAMRSILRSQLNPGISGVLVHVLSFVTFEDGAETKKPATGIIWMNWAREELARRITPMRRWNALLTERHCADIFLVKESRDSSMCVRCKRRSKSILCFRCLDRCHLLLKEQQRKELARLARDRHGWQPAQVQAA